MPRSGANGRARILSRQHTSRKSEDDRGPRESSFVPGFGVSLQFFVAGCCIGHREERLSESERPRDAVVVANRRSCECQV